MLLKILGLSPPVRGVPSNPPRPGGPTGPLRRPGDLPREEIRGTPQKRQLTNEQFDELYKRLPANPRQRAEALAELGTRIGDEARKHTVVRDLRDLIAKVQPFMSKADAKKKLDDALNELFSKGIKKGVMAILEQAFGEAPERPTEGVKPDKAPGEHLVDGPEFDSPFDKPKPVQRFAFRFEDVPSRVPPSKYFKLKLRVPTDFKPDDKKYGATRVVCQSLADHTTNPGRPLSSSTSASSTAATSRACSRWISWPRTRPASTCCSSTAWLPSRNRSRTLRSASSRAVEHQHGEFRAGLGTHWSQCVVRDHEPRRFAAGFFAEWLRDVFEHLPEHL